MAILDYANSNLGTQLDNGQKGYLGECVSLAIRAMHDVYGVPYGTLYCSTTGGARDLFEQFDGKIPTYFDRIPNDPNNYNQLPQPGDLIIWGSFMGKYGHVGVVIQASPLKVFQQLGYPVYAKTEIKQYVNYNGVLGWLRPKVTNTSQGGNEDMIKPEDRTLLHDLSIRLKLWSDPIDMDREMKAWVGQDWRRFLSEGMNESSAQYSELKAVAQTATELGVTNSNLTAANGKLVDKIEQMKADHAQQLATMRGEYEAKLAEATGKTVYVENPETGKKLDAILKALASLKGMVANLFKKK